VTNIFLLERLKDRALHEQIVSRANRMGATGPVHVTTLLARARDDEVTED
jgi:SNF2 family DNA or RNA helicase